LLRIGIPGFLEVQPVPDGDGKQKINAGFDPKNRLHLPAAVITIYDNYEDAER
jgi:hypothetical protein